MSELVLIQVVIVVNLLCIIIGINQLLRKFKKDFKIIDKYNPNTKVIDAQVVAAGGWSKYKGQILHLNSDFSELYSLSDVDSVIYDADSEFQASLFKNTGLRKGFFGAKLFITKPFSVIMKGKNLKVLSKI
jgi:hypothetical protein